MGATTTRRRKFEIGFKRQVVQEVESGGLSLSAAGRENEISPILISQWRDKVRDGILGDKPFKRERDLEQELDRYKVLLIEPHADREFLKKAQDYAQRLKKQSTAVITGLNIDQFRIGAK